MINKTSLLHHTYYETRKQAIALLPTLSEKQGARYVFSLKHRSDGSK